MLRQSNVFFFFLNFWSRLSEIKIIFLGMLILFLLFPFSGLKLDLATVAKIKREYCWQRAWVRLTVGTSGHQLVCSSLQQRSCWTWKLPSIPTMFRVTEASRSLGCRWRCREHRGLLVLSAHSYSGVCLTELHQTCFLFKERGALINVLQVKKSEEKWTNLPLGS